MIESVLIKRRRSKRPAILLAAVIVALTSLLAYQLWLSYRDQLRTAHVSTRNLATLFDTRLEATLRHTDANLQALIRGTPLAALSGQAAHLYELEVNASLSSHLFNAEELSGYAIHDAGGELLYTSDSPPTVFFNIADRPYFQRLRTIPDAGLVISDVLIGRNNGRPTIVMARAIRDPGGRFLGVIYGLLEVGYYTQQFQALDLGPHGIVALRRSDTDSEMFGWASGADQRARMFAGDDPVIKRLAAGESSFVVERAGIDDDVRRIVGVQALQNYPFYFLVGVGKQDVLADWRAQLWLASATTVPLLLLVAGLGLRLRRLRRREAGILNTLAVSESQFDSLAQRLPVGISRFDRFGRYSYVNDRLLAMSGRRREEFLGSDWSAFVHPDDRSRLQQSWTFTADRPPPSLFTCRMLRPDGSVFHLAGEIQPEADAEGRVSGFTVAQTDVSVRQEIEAELRVAKLQAETANMTKTRFLAAASHDLRQPLQAINLFLDSLERTSLSPEQRTITRFLSLSVQSLGDLLYALLDISKIDAGLVKPQMGEVLVESLFTTLDADFSTIARQRELRFKLFYPLADMVLYTDPVLLRSVMRNLVDNAFKYTERGGVLVGVRKRAGRAIIQVWDTGIGIDARYGEQIFEECFQVGNHLRERSKGLGIGLSIARRLSRLLRGEVSFRSRPGVGSVFELSVPLAEGSADMQRPGSVKPSSFDPGVSPDAADENESTKGLRGWQIVVVEDDPVVAKSVELSLQSLGLQVVVFADAEQALAWPAITGADFYLSDLVLPGQNGLELLEAITQRAPRPIHAALMTGETASARIEQIKNASRWPVLIKPADLSRLLAIMNAAAN